MREYVDAKRALDALLHQPVYLNPSAARSLEETLTVHRRRVRNKFAHSLGQRQYNRIGMVDTRPGTEVLLQHPKVALVKKDKVGYNAVRTPMALPIAEEVLPPYKTPEGR